jgi:putative DNA primase/helicase
MTAPAHTQIDRIAEIERLAALEETEYESARKEAAKRLAWRPRLLDREVAKKRRALGLEGNEDGAGQGRAVKVLEVLPWSDPIDGDRIATALGVALKNYAALPDEAADTITLWVLHTWMVNKSTVSPRLAITSPTKGCGKTTVLRFLNRVVCRPKRAGSISPAALFRAVEQFQPTILLDETEKYIEHGSDLHALLNEGHCKGATVMRVLGDKLELREFSIFGAVAFARNGSLPDDLEQRSIVIDMQRRLPEEHLLELREDRCESLQNLARMCARWADDFDIGKNDPDMGGLINRIADNWRALFTIADAIGSDWPARIREAAAVLAPRESDTTGTMLLADVLTIFEEHGERLWSEEMCECLAAIEGRPWAEFGRARKPISKHQLARLLAKFHIEPLNVRVGERVKRGYHRHQFADAWRRYPGNAVLEPLQRYNADEAGTSCTNQTATAEATVAVQKCQKSAPNGHCSSVAVSDADMECTADASAQHKCDHCQRHGETMQIAYGAAEAWLHRDCMDAWRIAYDQRDIRSQPFYRGTQP